jgi:hypothetical protein
MNLLKSYLRRKTAYYKSYYYKNTFFIYNFKDHYLQLNLNDLYNTQTSILFKGKVKFGANFFEVNSILGKSHFKIEDENIKNYVTIYYKSKIANLKNKSQLHFYNQHFFFGVQFFSYLSTQEKNELLNLIKIKYQLPLSLTLPITVKDKDENILVVRENMGLLLEYFSGDKLLVNSVLEAFEKEEQKALLKQKEAHQIILKSI